MEQQLSVVHLRVVEESRFEEFDRAVGQECPASGDVAAVGEEAPGRFIDDGGPAANNKRLACKVPLPSVAKTGR
jgi:hypothetical protein